MDPVLDNEVINPEALSKKHFEKFFLENLPHNKEFLKPQNEAILLKLDRVTHEQVPQMELSAAYLTCNTQQTAISTPRPSPFLEMEDLALRYELIDLEIALKTIFEIMEAKLQTDRIFPMTSDHKLLEFLKEVANEHLYETIFSKRYEYIKSLISSVGKTKRNIMIVSTENTLAKIQDDM